MKKILIKELLEMTSRIFFTRKSLVAVFVASLLLTLVGVQSSAGAVLISEFYDSNNSYQLKVSPGDRRISYTAQMCDGSYKSGGASAHKNNTYLYSLGAPIAWISNVLTDNGTITAYSYACPLGYPPSSSTVARNYYKDMFTDDESGFEALTPPKNGGIYYNAGTCSQNCIISPSIPVASKDSLPSDATSTLYVRLAGDGGSYTACFDVGELTNPVIYRYVAGEWVSQPVTVGGGKVCANASGDGAFALGGS